MSNKKCFFEILSDGSANAILDEINSPSQKYGGSFIRESSKDCCLYPKREATLGRCPVTMVLTYAEIPYTEIYDEEVLSDQLLMYEWLHLHHEDFTGQYGEIFGAYRNAPWYIEQKRS